MVADGHASGPGHEEDIVSELWLPLLFPRGDSNSMPLHGMP